MFSAAGSRSADDAAAVSVGGGPPGGLPGGPGGRGRLVRAPRCSRRRRHSISRRRLDSNFRCCGCLHVRTGTILLAAWHLTMHLVALSALLLMLLQPSSLQPPLPEATEHVNMTTNKTTIVFESEDAPDRLHSHEVPPPKVMPKHSGSGYSVLGGQVWQSDDIHVGLLVTLCLLVITLLLLVGALRRQPSYLMPFFCLQVFDFCISCLTLLSYFSLMPDARALLAQWPAVPCRQLLLQIDARWLALIIVLTFVTIMVVKAYLIGVVWACYRYLLLLPRADMSGRAATAISAVDPTLPLAGAVPPDYEAALHDARYAKIDLTHYPAPPPPYTAPAAAAADK